MNQSTLIDNGMPSSPPGLAKQGSSSNSGNGEEYRIKVHRKVALKYVESMVDRTEPRNLIVGFVTF